MRGWNELSVAERRGGLMPPSESTSSCCRKEYASSFDAMIRTLSALGSNLSPYARVPKCRSLDHSTLRPMMAMQMIQSSPSIQIAVSDLTILLYVSQTAEMKVSVACTTCLFRVPPFADKSPIKQTPRSESTCLGVRLTPLLGGL